MMLATHITAGAVALTAGAIAMSARKGGTLHRRAGIVFVCAMLVLCALGGVLAVLKPTRISIVVAGLTFYLVCTALLTVRRTVQESRTLITGFMLMATMVGAFGVRYGLVAAGDASGKLEGIPAALYFAFAFIAFAGALLDARLLRAGSIQGVPRLTRHLWRMGLAMSIATLSFFIGQAKLFPQEVRVTGVPTILPLLVAGYFIYWLVRVRLKRRALPAVS